MLIIKTQTGVLFSGTPGREPIRLQNSYIIMLIIMLPSIRFQHASDVL